VNREQNKIILKEKFYELRKVTFPAKNIEGKNSKNLEFLKSLPRVGIWIKPSNNWLFIFLTKTTNMDL
jgi:hypothetical protein